MDQPVNSYKSIIMELAETRSPDMTLLAHQKELFHLNSAAPL